LNAARLAARPDFEVIAGWIDQGAHVLDLGCGDGSLLGYLAAARGASGYGVEIAHANVVACVRNGVNVIQSDLESGLSGFEDGSFDCVILSQTLQAMRRTAEIMDEMLRVARQGIVSFPNVGYWRNRIAFARGRMPVSDTLPFQWHDTPNVHLCTIADFESFCAERGIAIAEQVALTAGRTVGAWPNFFGQLAVYRFERGRR